jgi:hypothetical protein
MVLAELRRKPRRSVNTRQNPEAFRLDTFCGMRERRNDLHLHAYRGG